MIFIYERVEKAIEKAWDNRVIFARISLGPPS